MSGRKKHTKTEIAPQPKINATSGLLQMKGLEKTLLLVQLYMDLVKEGMRKGEAFNFIHNRGYTNTQRHLLRQIALVEANGGVSARVTSAGRKAKLNEDQKEDLYIWVCEKNLNHEIVSRSSVKKYVLDEYNIDMTIQTAGNILASLNLTRKTCQVKTGGFKHSHDELKESYWKWILQMKRDNVFSIPLADICSIDVTYTRRPAQRVFTYSPLGGSKQKANLKAKLYTDAVVTMICADGINRYPSMLFTRNPKMAPEQKNTVRGRKLREEFEASLKRYNITEDRIVYIKAPKHFTGESPEIYEQFLTRNKVPKNVLILHDGGNAFKRGSRSILEEMGYANHVVYPTEVHQYLSPNDNNLHGCKAAWREQYYDFVLDVEAPLRLMELIDQDSVKNARYYFKRNLLNVTRFSVDELLGA